MSGHACAWSIEYCKFFFIFLQPSSTQCYQQMCLCEVLYDYVCELEEEFKKIMGCSDTLSKTCGTVPPLADQSCGSWMNASYIQLACFRARALRSVWLQQQEQIPCPAWYWFLCTMLYRSWHTA
eukprot:6467668-Amphidinium_carterae.2